MAKTVKREAEQAAARKRASAQCQRAAVYALVDLSRHDPSHQVNPPQDESTSSDPHQDTPAANDEENFLAVIHKTEVATRQTGLEVLKLGLGSVLDVLHTKTDDRCSKRLGLCIVGGLVTTVLAGLVLIMGLSYTFGMAASRGVPLECVFRECRGGASIPPPFPSASPGKGCAQGPCEGCAVAQLLAAAVGKDKSCTDPVTLPTLATSVRARAQSLGFDMTPSHPVSAADCTDTTHAVCPDGLWDFVGCLLVDAHTVERLREKEPKCCAAS